jgi:hypothetical protein
MNIVFMVAGISSRFNGNIKQLSVIGPNKETLIEYSVNQALTSPFSKVIFITNEKTEHHFKSIFGKIYNDRPVIYIRQEWDREKRARPWGTTGAVCALAGKINEPCIIVNSDDIYGESTFKKGYELLRNTNNNIIGGCLLEQTLPSLETKVNRAIIKVDDCNTVSHIYEEFNISAHTHSQLLKKYCSINFIGLQPSTILLLNKLLCYFQNTHKNDPMIEALLPNNLNTLIQCKQIKLEFFEINEQIYGITYPGDDIKLKEILC